jgi:hypothetical protein
MNIPKMMTVEFLRSHQEIIFVFGDNTIRRGLGGAAKLRYEPNTYGFITKKFPNNQDTSFYRPIEYQKIFDLELQKLQQYITEHPEKHFAISQLGGGLANKYQIFEKIIEPGLAVLQNLSNVTFLFSLRSLAQPTSTASRVRRRL